MAHPRPGSVFGAELRGRAIDPDAPIHWACSGKGWNCCVGKGIAVGPYDLLRLARETGTPPGALVEQGIVTFSWYRTGALVGMLARRPYERGEEACVFYHDVSNTDLAALRTAEPELFAALPAPVRRAADSTAPHPWRVAGLCGVHDGRPLVCRGFPFARRTRLDPIPGNPPAAAVEELHRCGTCALRSAETTPRAVLETEEVHPYWRAADAFEETVRYLRALGLAGLRRDDYTPLPVTEQERTELWAGMYLPESLPAGAAGATGATGAAGADAPAFPPADPAHDLLLLRRMLERALDAAEGLAAERTPACGAPPGLAGEPPPGRPRLDVLLDPARPLLPLAPLARSA